MLHARIFLFFFISAVLYSCEPNKKESTVFLDKVKIQLTSIPGKPQLQYLGIKFTAFFSAAKEMEKARQHKFISSKSQLTTAFQTVTSVAVVGHFLQQ